MGFLDHMPGVSGGDFLPIIKYNTKAGRLFRVESFQDIAGNWDKVDVEIEQGTGVIADFHNLEIGFVKFPAGGAPDFRLAVYREAIAGTVPFAIQPGEMEMKNGKEKKAFSNCVRFRVKTDTNNGDAVHELATAAQTVIPVFNALYDTYTKAPEAAQGLLPVIVLKGVNALTTKHGTNYEPVFVIGGWVARPNDMPLDGGAAPAPATNDPAPQDQGGGQAATPGAAVPQNGFVQPGAAVQSEPAPEQSAPPPDQSQTAVFS